MQERTGQDMGKEESTSVGRDERGVKEIVGRRERGVKEEEEGGDGGRKEV